MANHNRPLNLAAQLLDAQEQEHVQLIDWLHNDISQSLSTIKFNLELWLAQHAEPTGTPSSDLAPIQHQCQMLQTTLDEVRNLSNTLRPSLLDSLGLIIALQSLCRDYRIQHPQTLLIERFDLDEPQIPEHARLGLYRICQEALNNINQHASADQITLRLFSEHNGLTLEIADNGVGISANRVTTYLDSGLGLRSIQQRTHQLGGCFGFHSQCGVGTELTVRLPIMAAQMQK